MGTLSQTIQRELSYLDRLTLELYMFIDNRTFREEFFIKFDKNQVYNFSYQLVHTGGHQCKGFLFLRFSLFSLSFLKTWSKCSAWLFIETSRSFKNYQFLYEIITSCVP